MRRTDEFIAFSKQLAEASGAVIRKYFRVQVPVEEKADRSPVTIADREAERLMRQMIAEHYPDHGIIGEEFEPVNPEGEYQWILDPIDGTKNFVAGTCLFGSLIALMKDGSPILGVIHNPVIQQFLVGNGTQTWLNDQPVKVRPCKAIEEATLLTTSHWSAWKHRNGLAFEALTRRAKMYRTWGDCYGYYLVASGYADIMIDPDMHIWDIAPLIPIIQGAGGKLTDYYGNDPLHGQGAVATAGMIHDEVIQALSANGNH
jgi:myo-inositol-1(or 4)-monophosphatase